jgi:hypothetical protein
VHLELLVKLEGDRGENAHAVPTALGRERVHDRAVWTSRRETTIPHTADLRRYATQQHCRGHGRSRRLDGVEPLQMVSRGYLQRVLRDRAVEAGVEFRYDKRLVAAENTATGVTASFSDGTAPQPMC